MPDIDPQDAKNPSALARADASENTIPSWMTSELIERTQILWQRIYHRAIDREEAVTILGQVARLLDVLSS